MARNRIASGFLLLFVSACAANPITLPPLTNEAGVEVIDPLNARLVIHMRPEDRSSVNPTLTGIREGEIIERASIDAFKRLFAEVYTSRDTKSGDFIAVVSGTSSVQCCMTVGLQASATVVLQSANGVEIGRFDSSNNWGSSMLTLDGIVFENQYKLAFDEIARHILDNKRFLEFLSMPKQENPRGRDVEA